MSKDLVLEFIINIYAASSRMPGSYESICFQANQNGGKSNRIL